MGSVVSFCADEDVATDRRVHAGSNVFPVISIDLNKMLVGEGGNRHAHQQFSFVKQRQSHQELMLDISLIPRHSKCK